MEECTQFFIPYEKIKVGDSAHNSITISEELVDDFSRLIGDTNSFHVSSKSAAMTIFKKRIVHGVHLLAYLSVLIGQSLPGFGTIYCSHDFKFLSPVYIGDPIEISVEVVEKLSSNRIKLSTKIINLNTDVEVFDGIAVVKTYK